MLNSIVAVLSLLEFSYRFHPRHRPVRKFPCFRPPYIHIFGIYYHNYQIINYSTSSSPSYSSLSYDASGSFFDLDMSILEPNYLYEISFLYRDGTDYIEQKEKFKFRVNP